MKTVILVLIAAVFTCFPAYCISYSNHSESLLAPHLLANLLLFHLASAVIGFLLLRKTKHGLIVWWSAVVITAIIQYLYYKTSFSAGPSTNPFGRNFGANIGLFLLSIFLHLLFTVLAVILRIIYVVKKKKQKQRNLLDQSSGTFKSPSN